MKFTQWWTVVAVLLLAASGIALAQDVDIRHGGHGENRVYWIAADEIEWDFAPVSFQTDPAINLMSGEPFTEGQLVFLEDTPEFVGHIYLKALYRRYTSGFGHVIERSPAQKLLYGTLGPIIYAEVGDTITVHFKNNTRFPVSVHPHGVLYDKNSEGAPYTDSANDLVNTAPDDDAVPTGGTHTYVWEVPERAGPAPNDPSSVAWLYHSHTSETADTNAGLIGAIVITRKFAARFDGSPQGIDREFFSLFTIFNENSSQYLDENVSRFGADPDGPDFEESNLMHSINGLMFGNNKGYVMHVGEKVRWYILSMGTEVDLHTPHWHGVTLLHNGNRIDVTEVLPASTKTLDLRPDNPGTWMFHCHVNDHLDAGMITKFTILP